MLHNILNNDCTGCDLGSCLQMVVVTKHTHNMCVHSTVFLDNIILQPYIKQRKTKIKDVAKYDNNCTGCDHGGCLQIVFVTKTLICVSIVWCFP